MIEVIRFHCALSLAVGFVGKSRIAQPPAPAIAGGDMEPHSRAMRRDEHDRHNRKVARIQDASDRLLWWRRVLVRSLTVRWQP